MFISLGVPDDFGVDDFGVDDFGVDDFGVDDFSADDDLGETAPKRLFS